MKCCYTVNRISCVNCKPCHVNFAVVDNRHMILFLVIVWIFCTEFNKEAAVDFFYNLVDTREKSLENTDIPFFESFCKDCVVCVSKCFCYNIPAFVPSHAVFVHKDAHKFRNCNYRMCIIKLNCVEFREFREICSMVCYEVMYKVLEGSRTEEVLLL